MARTSGEITESISRLFDARALRFKWASRFVKAALISVGAAIAGVAQFLQIPQGEAPTNIQVVGIAAIIAVLLGSVFVLLLEDDASEELAAVRRAS